MTTNSDLDVSLTPVAALARLLGDYMRPGVGISADRLVRAGTPTHLAPPIASASVGIRSLDQAQAAAERFGPMVQAFFDDDPSALAVVVPR
jgi:hypothetical protein